ncbi:hypothetical protein [Kitasatospora sp. NPDC004272]
MNPSRPARARPAACAAAALVLLGPSGVAGAAVADGASPAAADLPVVTQTLPGVQQDGCRRPSGRTADRTPWERAYLRPEAAWPYGRGAGVTVAVLGSGQVRTSSRA